MVTDHDPSHSAFGVADGERFAHREAAKATGNAVRIEGINRQAAEAAKHSTRPFKA